AMRIDVNGAWTPAQAIEQIRLLQPFKLDWVEQPAREEDLDGFDLVRKSVGVPLCIDQGAQTNLLAYQAIARRLADFLCTDVHRMGGMLQTRAIASMARLVNMDVCRHASAEYGISATAHLHLAATIPNLTTGNQTYRTMI